MLPDQLYLFSNTASYFSSKCMFYYEGAEDCNFIVDNGYVNVCCFQ